MEVLQEAAKQDDSPFSEVDRYSVVCVYQHNIWLYSTL